MLDPPDGTFAVPPPFEELGSGLVSTAPDVLRFFCAMADGGAPVLTADEVALMTADALTAEQRRSARGFLGGGEPARPVLIDARPFQVIRFEAPEPPEKDPPADGPPPLPGDPEEDEKIRLSLEVEARVDQLMARYPLLMGELSYRPGLTCDGGKLCPEWRQLLLKYPNRFLVGSDTWVNQRWQYYDDLMKGYRTWLGDLPADVARRIAWDNGATLFGLKQP